jgi:hypothetical protein
MTDHRPNRPLEDELRQSLAAAVRGSEPGSRPLDLTDVGRRARARARRRRVSLASVAAVALVGAVAGGYALGGDSGQPAADLDEVATADRPSGVDPATPGVDVPDEVALPLVDPPQSGAGGDVTAPRSSPLPATEAATSSYWPGPGYGGGYGWGNEPMATLFTRTTDDGTVLDVRANRFPAGWAYDPGAAVPFWEPADWCFPGGSIYVGVRAPDAVGQSGAERYDALRDGTIWQGGGMIGGPEGSPRWVLVVQVQPDAGLVRVTFPDGRTDDVAPVEGVAALTAPMDEAFDLDHVWEQGGGGITVDVTAADGSEQRFRGPIFGGLVSAEGADAVDPWSDPACALPTELPAPGPQQPDDVAAATAAVEELWTRASGPGEGKDWASLVDDPTGVAEAEQQLLGSGVVESMGPFELPIVDLVFADATTAYFEYRVTGRNGPVLSDRFAEARLVDGSWVIDRASICTLYAQGGGRCEPPPD